jgi:anti-anti-sigma factor
LEEATVLHPAGALRAPATGDLLRRIELLLKAGERAIVLSLAGVTDIDAAGIGALVRARNLAEASGGRFRVVNAAGRTREMLARTGLLGILKANPAHH